MPVLKNETQKTINFGRLYPRLDSERERIGLSSFAEFIRHVCVRYLAEHSPQMHGIQMPMSAEGCEPEADLETDE